ncbi:hypothetical protein DLJ53_10420 [Acuticoccus sediminis]|uniref:HTH luxR-type domain-containing protein n=1 Tax=Acuticoccus sediminis TaxID=2184697 RepID=A0A8B2NSC2_9HYPH|nr:LuxR C-terminal-related transcriptional regulator [Acuticoccus sediminis]RAI01811.1 hypothetical protein DLJ53_10420 [Acuticoccus sediminis]
MLDVVQAIRAARDTSEVWRVTVAAFRECGAAAFSVGAAPREETGSVVICSDAPMDEMQREYFRNRIYRYDPWMELCQQTADPTTLDVPAAKRADSVMTPLAWHFGRHGIRYAVLFPAYSGPSVGGIALYAVSASGEATLRDPAMMQIAGVTASVFASRFHPATSFCPEVSTLRTNAALSDREKEALSWFARGLQTARVADKMGIADVTVNKHVASARRKLGARTRDQALALAVRSGEISF